MSRISAFFPNGRTVYNEQNENGQGVLDIYIQIYSSWSKRTIINWKQQKINKKSIYNLQNGLNTSLYYYMRFGTILLKSHYIFLSFFQLCQKSNMFPEYLKVGGLFTRINNYKNVALRTLLNEDGQNTRQAAMFLRNDL